jgi:UDP-N-acetylmuramoylalanine--D-glutamate ligase
VSDVVLEVSSFQLESIKRFKPDISVFLNFAPDHLDRHRSMEEYFEAKLRIFENQTQEDYAVINADDKRLEEYFLNAGYIYHGGGIMTNDKNGKKAKVNADVYFFSTIRRVKGVYADGEKIMFFDGNKTVKICGLNEIKLCGRHNLENVLAAMCAAKLRGIDNDAIIKALDGFVPPHNRIELVREVFGMRFFNDSKGTNIHATLAAIESMDGDTVLILGGSDKGEDFCELFSALPEKIKEICVTGQNAKKITEAAREFLKIKIAEFDTLYDCVKKATKTGCKNVLFSPASASFDRYKNYEERGRDFVKIVGGLADDNS